MTTQPTITTLERDSLKMHVFLSKPVLFRVASVVLEAQHELALVDAQFSADNARLLAEFIRSLGKPLRTIFISYSDPDYYFGLDVLRDHFPEARMITTPQTRYLIETCDVGNRALWSPRLKENAPRRIVIPDSLTDDHFTLEGRRIHIKQLPGDEQHPFLWIPSARTLLGGGYVVEGKHPWVVDAPTDEARDKWIAALEAMERMQPDLTIPAHFSADKSDFSGDAPLRFTRQYLINLGEALLVTRGSVQLMRKMRSLYPGLRGEENLEMTAKVLTGETPWQTTNAFPAIARRVEFDFGGDFLYLFDFHDERRLTYIGLRGSEKGTHVEVEYTAVEIAPKIFMTYWSQRDKKNVVLIQDYGRGIAWLHASMPDHEVVNLKGSLRLMLT